MAIERSRRPVGEARLRTLAASLLDSSTLCSIATVRSGGAYVNTAYFAWTPQFRLFWLSDPAATHSQNIRRNPSVAIAVFDSHQSWGKPDRGIQLFGAAFEIGSPPAPVASGAYAARFTHYRTSDLTAYRFYEFRPRRLKVFDEPALGAGTFVTARVGPGRKLTWERTHIYRISS